MLLDGPLSICVCPILPYPSLSPRLVHSLWFHSSAPVSDPSYSDLGYLRGVHGIRVQRVCMFIEY
jgi:hypothetical protein